MSKDAARAVALVVMALLPAYCSVDGLLTGEVLVLDRRTNVYAGESGVVTALSYALFAFALLLAASTFVRALSRQRKTLSKAAWNATLAATVLFFVGRIMSAFD